MAWKCMTCGNEWGNRVLECPVCAEDNKELLYTEKEIIEKILACDGLAIMILDVTPAPHYIGATTEEILGKLNGSQ